VPEPLACHLLSPAIAMKHAALRVGIDLVSVAEITASLERFGDRFLHRVFSPAEIAYASAAPALLAQRLAARFAAKEATMKVLEASDGEVDWRAIEVVRQPRTGSCGVRLSGVARAIARRTGVSSLALSLSHEAGCAAAVVVALLGRPRRADGASSRPARRRRGRATPR
jgi:holo-[acyl-carrier protein] synthase